MKKDYKKLNEIVPYSLLHLTFKTVPIFEFWCSSNEYLQLSEKNNKIITLFFNYMSVESIFFSYTSTKTDFNRLNAGLDIRIQLSSSKPFIYIYIFARI